MLTLYLSLLGDHGSAMHPAFHSKNHHESWRGLVIEDPPRLAVGMCLARMRTTAIAAAGKNIIISGLCMALRSPALDSASQR